MHDKGIDEVNVMALTFESRQPSNVESKARYLCSKPAFERMMRVKVAQEA
jgi:hypothetical protein